MGGDMGAKNSGTGIKLRKGARSETIRIVFQYQGKRCREPLKLEHTRNNIAFARRLQGAMVNAIERGTFVYEEFFPDSLTTRRQKQALADAQAAAAAKARPPVLVGDLLRDYLLIARRNLELSTYNCYQQVAKNHLFPQWEDKPAAELTTRDLRKWIMGLNGKSKTIQLILTPMRNAIELGVTEGDLESNPFDSIKLGKLLPRDQRVSKFKADPFNIDEMELILNACERDEERNMLQFAFCIGMRPSEYIALQWPAVDEPHHQVSVAGAFVDGEMKDRAKTLSGLRTIDMRCGALAALQAQYPLTGAGAGTVFLHPRSGKPWQGDKPIYNCWKRIIKASGVRFRNPYQTRHTFASNLLMLGALPLYVATQMGHADTTMIVRTYGKWIAAGLDHGRRERLLCLYAQTNPLRADEFPKYN